MRKHIRSRKLDPPSNEGDCNAEDPPSDAKENTPGIKTGISQNELVLKL